MKRLICFLVSICSLTIGWASNTLTLNTSSGAPNEQVTLTASLSIIDPVVATEVVIPLGEHISYVPNSVELNAARSNGHVISAAQVGTDLRVYIYSLSLQPLVGAEGELFRCQLLLGNEPITQALVPQVVLSGASGVNQSCSTTNANIQILAPKLEVVTPTIDYGHIPIRSTYTRSLQMRNVGTTPLTISSINFSVAEFSEDVLPITIEPGSLRSVTITYAPTNRGAIQEQLTIQSDAVNGMFNAVRTVSLVADPFSVNELHVGSASGISDDTVTVSLTMNNMEPIVAGEVSFKLPAGLEAVENSFRLSARSNGHAPLTRLHGDTLTLYFYSLTNQPLAGNDGEIGTFQLRLNSRNGQYLRPIDVVLANATMENMVSATSQGRISIQSPQISTNSSLILPATSVTETSSATFIVSNNGSAPLVIDKVTFLQSGLLCLTPLPLRIERWSNAEMQVQFAPEKEGSVETLMQIYSNDPAKRMLSVALTGVAYEPNQLTLSGEAVANEYVLSVGLKNYSAVTALQFDIEGLPEAGVTMAPTDRLSAHSSMLSPLGDGVYRALVFSMTNGAVSDHDGAIMQIHFPLSSHVDVSLSGIVISTASASDKSSTTMVSWQDDVEMVYRRAVTDGNYGTICLPYTITEYARTGASFYSIAGVMKENGVITGIVMLEIEGDMVAGMPYIYKACEDELVCTYSGEGVNAPVDATGLVGSFIHQTATYNDGKDDLIYFLKNNVLYHWTGTGEVTRQANKAIFYLDGVDEYTGPASAPRVQRIAAQVDRATDVELVGAEALDKFFLNGQVYILRDGHLFDTTGRLVK